MSIVRLDGINYQKQGKYGELLRVHLRAAVDSSVPQGKDYGWVGLSNRDINGRVDAVVCKVGDKMKSESDVRMFYNANVDERGHITLDAISWASHNAHRWNGQSYSEDLL